MHVYGFDENGQRVQRSYRGSGPLGTGEFWTITIPGDTVYFEYYVPNDGSLSDDDLPFSIDAIIHNYIDPIRRKSQDSRFLKVGNCHNDICTTPSWQTSANGVVGISTVGGSAGLWCTGALLGTEEGDDTPYVLTAYHCIGSEAEANAAEFHWFYQRNSCSTGVPSPDRAVSSYSTLVSGMDQNRLSDYALLMVFEALPSGVTYLGWTTAEEDEFNVAGIHHPDGSHKRISFGRKDRDALQNYHIVTWRDGVTEPGSSGSPLFATRGGQHYVVGQLYGGYASCTNPTGIDYYGSFAQTYTQIEPFLRQGADDNFEGNDSSSTALALDSAGTIDDLIVKSTNEDWFSIDLNAGEEVVIQTSFKHSFGDVDLQLRSAGQLVAEAGSSTDNEEIRYRNRSSSRATVQLRVFLYSGQRNRYTLSINGVAREPEKVQLIAPSGSINSAIPTFRWRAISVATQYHIWVNDASGNRVNRWVSANAANCSNGTCEYASPVTLSRGAGDNGG